VTGALTILAIESSCDDTAAAVLQDGLILSNVVANQQVHEKYGGVVPELASRAHQKNIVPVVDAALKQAQVKLDELSAVAFTSSPGLIGSLLVGTSFAKALALSLDIPLIAVNHMEAHVMAHFIAQPIPQFPFMCLTVSGGHTLIELLHADGRMENIGQTLDDAAGEAFDKCAKLLGLPYPGGPLIDLYAKDGNPNTYSFPVSSVSGFDFSFSGLKTSFLNFLKHHTSKNPDFIANNLADCCASVQHAIIQQLIAKLESAATQYGVSHIGIAGGVSANSVLRNAVEELGIKHNWNTYIPAFEYCTDNAAMIAMAAWYKYRKQEFSELTITPSAK
jgi:N6-L-threonylcarbamoyladenine synthase